MTYFQSFWDVSRPCISTNNTHISCRLWRDKSTRHYCFNVSIFSMIQWGRELDDVTARWEIQKYLIGHRCQLLFGGPACFITNAASSTDADTSQLLVVGRLMYFMTNANIVCAHHWNERRKYQRDPIQISSVIVLYRRRRHDDISKLDVLQKKLRHSSWLLRTCEKRWRRAKAEQHNIHDMSTSTCRKKNAMTRYARSSRLTLHWKTNEWTTQVSSDAHHENRKITFESQQFEGWRDVTKRWSKRLTSPKKKKTWFK